MAYPAATIRIQNAITDQRTYWHCVHSVNSHHSPTIVFATSMRIRTRSRNKQKWAELVSPGNARFRVRFVFASDGRTRIWNDEFKKHSISSESDNETGDCYSSIASPRSTRIRTRKWTILCLPLLFPSRRDIGAGVDPRENLVMAEAHHLFHSIGTEHRRSKQVPSMNRSLFHFQSHQFFLQDGW